MGLSLFYLLYDCFDTLYLLTLCLFQYLLQFIALNGGIGVAVFHVDASYLVASEPTGLAEETYDVALGNLVLLALADVDCSHFRKGRFCKLRLSRNILLNVALYVVWNVFAAVQDEERATCGIPAGSTTHTMDVAVLAFWQVIVDDVLDIGNIEAA